MHNGIKLSDATDKHKVTVDDEKEKVMIVNFPSKTVKSLQLDSRLWGSRPVDETSHVPHEDFKMSKAS